MRRLSVPSMRNSVNIVPRISGMSLVELLVAVALGLLILAGLTTVFVNTSTARREVEQTSQQIENGRYAIDILADDLRMAGYFGELNPASANGIFIPAVAAPATLPDPCTIPPDLNDLRAALYLHMQGYHNGSLLPAACLVFATNIKTNADASTNPDIVAVRRTRACTVDDPGCVAVNNSKVYLHVSLCATEASVTPYALALGSAAPTLRLKGATPTTCGGTVSRREYLTHVYFVSADNGAGVNVPTLKRLELDVVAGALKMKEVALVEGIEQLNIEYGLDYMDSGGLPNTDGIPDSYTSDPTTFSNAAGCATCVFNEAENWRNVVTARFYVLARNIEHSPGLSDEAKNKTYTLGRKPDGTALTVGPFNDSYRRHIYSSLVRITNPAGRRDRPL